MVFDMLSVQDKPTLEPECAPPPRRQTEILAEAQRAILDFRQLVAENIPDIKQQELIYDALHFTEELCEGYRPRGDGRARIIHPIEVAADLIRKFGVRNTDIIIAGLLHDAAEDQPEKVVKICGTPPGELTGIRTMAIAAIGQRYGSRAAAFVSYLTNPDCIIDAEALARTGEPRDQRLGIQIVHDNYHDHFIDIAAKHRYGFMIKVADFGRNAMRLDLVTDPAKREVLAEKYFPAMIFLDDYLQEIKDPSNPLCAHRDWLRRDIHAALKRDYGSGLAQTGIEP